MLTFLYLDSSVTNVIIYSVFYISYIIICISGSITFSRYRIHSFLHEENQKEDNMVLKNKLFGNIKDIENANYITIYSLAKLAESRDQFTGDHIDRVGNLCI